MSQEWMEERERARELSQSECCISSHFFSFFWTHLYYPSTQSLTRSSNSILIINSRRRASIFSRFLHLLSGPDHFVSQGWVWMQDQRFKLVLSSCQTISSRFPSNSSPFFHSPFSLEFFFPNFLPSIFFHTGKSSCGLSNHGQDMKVMIKRNSSSSSSSITDGRTETTTSCKKMKSDSSCSSFSPRSEKGEEGNSLECSVTRNGNIESTEKVFPSHDVTDEVMMMKKTSPSPSSSPPHLFSPTSHPTYSSSSHQSAPISPSSPFSPNNMKKRNRSTESNSRNDIMTTTLPSEEEHSIEVKGEGDGGKGKEGKLISCSDNSFGWHPHVYHQTPKKLTAFSILDILNHDDRTEKNSPTKSPSSHSNNNTADVIEERKKKKTCNNKLNRKQRSPSTSYSLSSSSIAQNTSSVHSSSSPSIPSSKVPSSVASPSSSSPLLLHQLHQSKSTKPTAPLIASTHLLSPSSVPRNHSNKTKKTNLSLSRGSKAYKKDGEEEQEDHYQVCHSLVLLFLSL